MLNTSSIRRLLHASPLRRNMLDKYNVMGGVESQLPTIQGVKKTGFVVGNTNLRGGIMLLNGGIFLWDVAQSHEITRPTLAPLEMVVPVPEILVVGTGADMQPLTKEVVEMLRELGIQHEVMPSKRAASTYNVLAQEGRNVAAAILPPTPVSARELNLPDEQQ